MLKLFIDSATYDAEAAEHLIDVINRTGRELPQVCYHPQLGVIQTCDTCLVEVDGQLVRPCGSTVSEEMQVVTASTNGRLLEHFHEGNMTFRVDGIKAKTPYTWIEISPQVAAERRIETGRWVEPTSRHGRVRILTLVTDRAQRHELYIPMNSTESPVNRLTGSHTDPVTQTIDELFAEFVSKKTKRERRMDYRQTQEVATLLYPLAFGIWLGAVGCCTVAILHKLQEWIQ